MARGGPGRRPDASRSGDRGGSSIGGPPTQAAFTYNPILPSCTIVNARVGVLKGKWDVALYATNLTDEGALLAFDRERGTLARIFYLTNQPRAFGVSARVNFQLYRPGAVRAPSEEVTQFRLPSATLRGSVPSRLRRRSLARRGQEQLGVPGASRHDGQDASP